jgi:nitrogen fixation protein NifQ
VVPDDEAALRDLLWRASSGHSRLEARLAAVLARRAQLPNHLWQDLGLRNRRELSWLMERHFAPLAARNAHDMKWKKFLYRTICRDTDMSLCVAPVCSECDDYDACFGDESGPSLLAPRGEQQPESTP